MDKRKQQRTRKRLACELVIGAKSYVALVRDVSVTGLFVQTRVKVEPDTQVEVIFSEYEGQPEMKLSARVARLRVVAPGLQRSVPDGIGLEIQSLSQEFLELVSKRLAAVGGPAELPRDVEASSGTGIRTFRVRLTERDRPNSRVITVRSGSLNSARARALARVGRAWKITDIQEI